MLCAAPGPTPPYLSVKTNRLDLFVIVVVSATYFLPVGGSSARILRLVRVLTPMLELMRNEALSTLIKTFAMALPAVGSVMVLLSIFLAVFGIVGVEYFAGRMYRCVHTENVFEKFSHLNVPNR